MVGCFLRAFARQAIHDELPKGLLVVSLFAGEVLSGHDQRFIRAPCRDGVLPADRVGRQVAVMGVQQHDVRAIV